MTDWARLIDELAEVFLQMPGQSAVQIVEAIRPDEGRYVDVYRMADGRFSAEASARPLAVPGPSINADELLSRGWAPPDERHVTWWLEASLLAPLDYNRLASQLVGALDAGLGIASPAELAYRAWQDGRPHPLTYAALSLPTVEVSYYVHLAVPGDTPQRPSGVLRRVTVGERVVDQACGPDLRWAPTTALSQPGTVPGELRPVQREAATAVLHRWRNG